MMLSSRDAQDDDYDRIARFPQNQAEAFFMFPKGTYPFDPDQLREAARQRSLPTSILLDGAVAAYANLYGLENNLCWLGNVIVNAQARRQELVGT